MKLKGGEISSGHDTELKPTIYTQIGMKPRDAVLNHPKENVKQDA